MGNIRVHRVNERKVCMVDTKVHRVHDRQVCMAKTQCTWCMREKYASGADPGFGQRGPQVLRPKVADVAKQSCASEASK